MTDRQLVPPAGRPRIALTLGDPAGIGPELGARLLADPATSEAADVVVVAGDDELARGAAQAGVERAELRSEVIDPGRLRSGSLPVSAQSSAAAGAWALAGLRFALGLAERGEVDGICFAPLNKSSLHLAGMAEEDELRWFANTLGHTGRTSEFNVLETLWTARVTSHVALAEVSKLITADAVADTVDVLDRALRDSGLPRPRIAVAALNPHAGENGHFGREEIDLITPGIEKAAAAGAIVSGPFPSDTIFGKATAGEFDGVVTMYHDQGQIAMKLIGFDRGVTVQGGLPIPITTPAHGTAFDIVGAGRAGVGAMQHAFRLAARLARATLIN
jgi:4-hydroxythreonine-4-phosphate dehydrogenase